MEIEAEVQKLEKLKEEVDEASDKKKHWEEKYDHLKHKYKKAKKERDEAKKDEKKGDEHSIKLLKSLSLYIASLLGEAVEPDADDQEEII